MKSQKIKFVFRIKTNNFFFKNINNKKYELKNIKLKSFPEISFIYDENEYLLKKINLIYFYLKI
jgi:ribosome-binding factor A